MEKKFSTMSQQPNESNSFENTKNIEKILETQVTQTQMISKLSKSIGKDIGKDSPRNSGNIEEALIRTNKAVNRVTSFSKTLSCNVEDIQDGMVDLRGEVGDRFRELESRVEGMQNEIKLYRVFLVISVICDGKYKYMNGSQQKDDEESETISTRCHSCFRFCGLNQNLTFHYFKNTLFLTLKFSKS